MAVPVATTAYESAALRGLTSQIRRKLSRVLPEPANAADVGGSLRVFDLRTSGKLQSVIEWRMLKCLQVTARLFAKTLRS